MLGKYMPEVFNRYLEVTSESATKKKKKKKRKSLSNISFVFVTTYEKH